MKKAKSILAYPGGPSENKQTIYLSINAQTILSVNLFYADRKTVSNKILKNFLNAIFATKN